MICDFKTISRNTIRLALECGFCAANARAGLTNSEILGADEHQKDAGGRSAKSAPVGVSAATNQALAPPPSSGEQRKHFMCHWMKYSNWQIQDGENKRLWVTRCVHLLIVGSLREERGTTCWKWCRASLPPRSARSSDHFYRKRRQRSQRGGKDKRVNEIRPSSAFLLIRKVVNGRGGRGKPRTYYERPKTGDS